MCETTDNCGNRYFFFYPGELEQKDLSTVSLMLLFYPKPGAKRNFSKRRHFFEVGMVPRPFATARVMSFRSRRYSAPSSNSSVFFSHDGMVTNPAIRWDKLNWVFWNCVSLAAKWIAVEFISHSFSLYGLRSWQITLIYFSHTSSTICSKNILLFFARVIVTKITLQ